MKITAVHETWPLDGVFTISRGSRTETEVVAVSLESDGIIARAECVPYARYDESIEGVIDQINTFANVCGNSISHDMLLEQVPAGAARNALDCALWDLKAKQAGKRVWELLGVPAPQPVTTVFTLSLDEPQAMGVAAARHANRPQLKIKLGPTNALECIQAVHENAPNSQLVVDANEAWNADEMADAMPWLANNGVILVEQPLPVGKDEALRDMNRTVPVAADESCHVASDIDDLADRYDVVNIKLDKTGGLTEALHLRNRAREAGLGIMIGCMVSTSLAMAPAMLLTAGAVVVDLDGPLLLARDRQSPLVYSDSSVYPPEAALWG